MKITESSQGDMLTMSITVDTMSGPVTATLSSRYRCAMIDGLLWWSLNRKLDAYVASAMHLPLHNSMPHAQAISTALAVGQALDQYVHTAPFHEETEARALRILHTVQKNLPDLAPLATLGPEHRNELLSLQQMAEQLRDRIAHSGDTMRCMEGILVGPVCRAA